MPNAEHVHFLELVGADAQRQLAAQAERWHAQGVRTTLLQSSDERGVWLLIGRAEHEPPPAHVDGARCWRFRRVSPGAP